MFRAQGSGVDLPRSFDRVDEAALVDQGMTPGMVVSSLTQAELEAVMAQGPQPGLIVNRIVSHLPINPDPQEGLDYWVWLGLEDRMQWVPARFSGGAWYPAQVSWLARPQVKMWRGPMVPPEVPTPAQVDKALG